MQENCNVVEICCIAITVSDLTGGLFLCQFAVFEWCPACPLPRAALWATNKLNILKLGCSVSPVFITPASLGNTWCLRQCLCGLGRPATGAESGGPRVINFRSSEAAGTCITYYNTQLDTIIKAALRATMYLNARNRSTSPPIWSDTILFNCPISSLGYWQALEAWCSRLCWLVVTDQEEWWWPSCSALTRADQTAR